MKNRLVVLIFVAILLTGCFGGVVEKELDSIELSVDQQNIIEPNYVKPGETVKITAVGRAENGQSIAIEPVWSLDDESKGTLTQDNPTEFTAAADASGKVTITATVEDVSEEVTLEITELEIASVVANWGSSFVDEGGGSKALGKTGDPSRGGYSSEYFFINYNDPGQWVEWDMTIPADGEYRLVVRYSTHKDPQFVRRNFTLRKKDAELEDAYIDKTYDLPSGNVSKDEGNWMFYLSDLLELNEGDHKLRMEFIDIAEDESNQFSNVLMVAFVAADPVDAKFDQAYYIEVLDASLGL